jgi:hypothetical protein
MASEGESERSPDSAKQRPLVIGHVGEDVVDVVGKKTEAGRRNDLMLLLPGVVWRLEALSTGHRTSVTEDTDARYCRTAPPPITPRSRTPGLHALDERIPLVAREHKGLPRHDERCAERRPERSRALDEREVALYHWESELGRAVGSGTCPVCGLRRGDGERPTAT